MPPHSIARGLTLRLSKQGTGLFCTQGECVCVRLVKVCASASARVGASGDSGGLCRGTPPSSGGGCKSSCCWLLVLHTRPGVAGGRQGHGKAPSRVLSVPGLALGSLRLPLRGTPAALTFEVQLVSRPRDPDPDLAQQLRSAQGCGHPLPGCLT